MLETFLRGAVAGYGVAVPVGAIALLILETGIRSGFLCAASAGTGAAVADLFYVVLAVVAGSALSTALEPWAGPLQWASALVLIALGLWGLWGARKAAAAEASAVPAAAGRREVLRTFGKFLGLTVLNPMTVVYFAALILGLKLNLSLAGGLVFALGAFLASLSWQLLLAAVGAVAGRGLPPRFRVLASAAGNLVVVGFGVLILLRAA